MKPETDGALRGLVARNACCSPMRPGWSHAMRAARPCSLVPPDREGSASPQGWSVGGDFPHLTSIYLSPYETLTIRIKETTCKRILLFIKTYVEGVSLPDSINASTLRHNQYNMDVEPGTQQYTINLKDFSTPAWWLTNMHISRVLLSPEHFTKVVTFDMQFNLDGVDYILNKPEQITIEQLAFRKPLTTISLIVLIGVSLYLCSLSILVIRYIRLRKAALPEQKPVAVASHRSDEVQRIKDFIAVHYSDEEISTRMLYDALGIPAARIFTLIKEEYSLTFKQLINRMRIEEAKRILRETDLRIIDISFKLGFNNISYFNNIFKALEGVTPSDYRKQCVALKHQ